MPCVLIVRYYVCCGLEFILQVTIKLISVLNLVNFMKYVAACRNLNEFVTIYRNLNQINEL
jgi:hypothetical protein